jgi:hypothetical protein
MLKDSTVDYTIESIALLRYTDQSMFLAEATRYRAFFDRVSAM